MHLYDMHLSRSMMDIGSLRFRYCTTWQVLQSVQVDLMLGSCRTFEGCVETCEQPPLFGKEMNSLWMETFFSNPPCQWERGGI